jgi:SAM-dependent methyltransferase
MTGKNEVADHYTHGSLLDAIRTGLETTGKTPETVTIHDLAPIDEFHIGGRIASEEFLGQLALTDGIHALDVGCGLGGGARFAVHQFGCQVSGVDLTPEFVETGQALCGWLGLGDQVHLQQGSALELPFADGHFDAAYMMHVGMNIADKKALFAEVSRVLKPGAVFGVYDVMQTGPGEMTYPVPWASTSATSALAAPQDYKSALESAGFDIKAERNRRDFALQFFADLSAKVAAAGGPPPLGSHILMGEDRAEMVKNMVTNITAGRIAPVEIVARK